MNELTDFGKLKSVFEQFGLAYREVEESETSLFPISIDLAQGHGLSTISFSFTAEGELVSYCTIRAHYKENI